MDEIIIKIFESKFLHYFKNTTSPRWLILLIDMLIVSASYFLVVAANLHRQPHMSVGMIIGNWVLIVLIYLIASLITRNHSFIIRLSVIEDLFKTFVMVLSASLVLIFINLGVLIFTGEACTSFWNIIFIATLTLSLMMSERLLIKHAYNVAVNANVERKRAVVFGTTLASLGLVNALKNEIGGHYEPVGLFSNNEHEHADSFGGFEVFHYNDPEISQKLHDKGVSTIIVTKNDLNVARGSFADFCFKNNIDLFTINQVAEISSSSSSSDKADKKGDISRYVKKIEIEDLLGRDPIVLNSAPVKNQLSDQVVMITGGCGSIGGEIVRQVAAYRASRIIIVDQAETPMHDIALSMQRSYPDIPVELYVADVTNYERLEVIFRRFQPAYVFHAAAYKHVPMMELNPTEAVLTNVLGTKNVADLSLKYGVKKFVMVSTDKAVNPTNVMGCTKRLAEIYTQSLFFDAKKRGLDTQFITTRFGNVLGSNGSVVPLFKQQIAEGGPVTITHRDIIRYFMTIPEACSLVLEAGSMGSGGEIYIFDMGEPVRIYDLARRMISLAGFKPDVDIQIKEVGLRPGEKLYEELLNDKEKTIGTFNKKIMIAKVRTYDYDEVNVALNEIITRAAHNRIHDMILKMKQFVPEFKSNQSRFEDVDREIESQSENSSEKEATMPHEPETEKYY